MDGSGRLPSGNHRAGEAGLMLVVAAGAMVVLLGFMELVVDIGWSEFQKRVAQNAADAAALAAIRDLGNAGASCDSTALNNAVDGHITTYSQANAGSDATFSYHYTDNNGNTVNGNDICSPAAGATTVEVTVANPYNTFFLSILGISTGSTTAIAAGRVGVLSGLGAPSPLVGCGTDLVRVSDNTPVDILTSGSPPGVDPPFQNVEFYLHGNAVGLNGGDCGLGTDMKGVAQTTQDCPSLPCNYDVHSGNMSGPVATRVAGALPGCNLDDASNDDALNNCVLIVPLADSSVDSDTVHVVTYACFYMHKTAPNEHTGTLEGACYTTGPSTSWHPGQTGALVLGLVK